MTKEYYKIKTQLLKEGELDFTYINNYLKKDPQKTIDLIFQIFYDSITTSTYEELYTILANIEEIINKINTRYYKMINNKVREINYKLSKLNINTTEFKNIKIILIDLNRKMRIKKAAKENFDTYSLYYHLIFIEKNQKAVEAVIKYKKDILKVHDKNGNNIFYNIIEHYLTIEDKEEKKYFYNIIMHFLHNLEEEILENKKIYLEKLSQKEEEEPIKEIIKRIKETGKIDITELEKKYHISLPVNKSVLKELSSFQINPQGRTFIDSNFITIDDEDALCLDDTISLFPNEDGSYYFYVGITDIPSIIPYKSKTFYDALRRVETIYLIDRTIDLYHTSISNGLCSLFPHMNRNVLFYRYLIDPSFHIDPDSLKIIRGVVNVSHRLSYRNVDNNIGIDPATSEMLEKISILINILKNSTARKEKYRRVENYVKKTASFHPSNYTDKSISANIIQESMLLVNSTVPKYFSDRGLIYTYRNQKIHNQEEADRLFAELTRTYGGTIPEKEYQNMITLLSTSYLNAYYSIINEGHEALGYDYYSHSTSAGRRDDDSYNQYLQYLQLFGEPLTDRQHYELEEWTRRIVGYINEKKKENQRFQNEYNYLFSKGRILERRK